MPGIKDGLTEKKELDIKVIELIKRILRLKSIDRDRGTYSATGDSLDLSDDAQASDDSRRSKGESTVRDGVSQDEINYKGGAAYKALLNIFAEHLDDEKFVKHCKKFFKGEK